jgi:hypothetical protein
MMAVVAVFSYNQEISEIKRELKNGFYNPISYHVANTLIQVRGRMRVIRISGFVWLSIHCGGYVLNAMCVLFDPSTEGLSMCLKVLPLKAIPHGVEVLDSDCTSAWLQVDHSGCRLSLALTCAMSA